MKTIAVIKLIKTIQIQHKETGAAARAARQARFLSLRAMAVRMKVSAPYICDLERGYRNWSIARIRAYEKALEL